MKQVFGALIVLGFVAGCGGLGNSLGNSANSASSGSAGSANSANSARSSGSSFGLGRSRTEATQTVDSRTVSAGGRRLVSVLKQARIERTRDGAIVYATALHPRQGYYDGQLFSETGTFPDENGVLTLEFRAKEPEFQTPVSTERSRLMTVGVFVPNQRLAATSRIVLVGRQNQIVLRR